MEPKPADAAGLARLKRLLKKDYRDGYLDAKVRGGIAYQMRALRKKFGLSQADMARKLGLKQSVVSRLEDVDRGNVTISTLLNVAQRLDVALVVQFVDYPEFLDRTRSMSDSALQPETIQESVASTERRIALTSWKGSDVGDRGRVPGNGRVADLKFGAVKVASYNILDAALRNSGGILVKQSTNQGASGPAARKNVLTVEYQ